MDTVTTCPECRRKLRIAPGFEGRSVRCPSCGTVSRAAPPERFEEDEQETIQDRKPARRERRPANLALRIVAILLAVAAAGVASVFGTIGAINKTSDINTFESNPFLIELAQAAGKRVDLDEFR